MTRNKKVAVFGAVGLSALVSAWAVTELPVAGFMVDHELAKIKGKHIGHDVMDWASQSHDPEGVMLRGVVIRSDDGQVVDAESILISPKAKMVRVEISGLKSDAQDVHMRFGRIVMDNIRVDKLTSLNEGDGMVGLMKKLDGMSLAVEGVSVSGASHQAQLAADVGHFDAVIHGERLENVLAKDIRMDVNGLFGDALPGGKQEAVTAASYAQDVLDLHGVLAGEPKAARDMLQVGSVEISDVRAGEVSLEHVSVKRELENADVIIGPIHMPVRFLSPKGYPGSTDISSVRSMEFHMRPNVFGIDLDFPGVGLLDMKTSFTGDVNAPQSLQPTRIDVHVVDQGGVALAVAQQPGMTREQAAQQLATAGSTMLDQVGIVDADHSLDRIVSFVAGQSDSLALGFKINGDIKQGFRPGLVSLNEPESARVE